MLKCPYCYEALEEETTKCPHCNQFLIDDPLNADFPSLEKKEVPVLRESHLAGGKDLPLLS